jgi:hypothetical protein
MIFVTLDVPGRGVVRVSRPAPVRLNRSKNIPDLAPVDQRVNDLHSHIPDAGAIPADGVADTRSDATIPTEHALPDDTGRVESCPFRHWVGGTNATVWTAPGLVSATPTISGMTSPARRTTTRWTALPGSWNLLRVIS